MVNYINKRERVSDSFSNVDGKLNPFYFIQITPVTKTCLFFFNGRTLYTSLPKHLPIPHSLHFWFFFMSLHTSSYVAYDMTARNFNGMDVSCQVKRVELISFRYIQTVFFYIYISIKIFRQVYKRHVVTYFCA